MEPPQRVSTPLVVYKGVTDADGNVGGTTLKCSDIGSASTYPDFDGNQIIIRSGSYKGQARSINGTTNGDAAGTITVADAFDGTILSGTSFIITGIRSAIADIAALQADVDNIFDLVNAILMLMETGGTITTTGAVQTVYINDAPAGVFRPKKILIDCTAHLAADTVVVRVYYRIKSGGGLIKEHENTIVGVQDPALIPIDLEPNRFGIQVTVEKTAGANHAYDWEVLYKA